jgi:hypothetical protein
VDELFAGFFATVAPDELEAAESVIEKAVARWAGCRGKLVFDPFIGLAVAAPGFARSSYEQYVRSLEMAGPLEADLPAWSRQFPTLHFVFIRWEQLGWETQYSGFACRNGAVTNRITGEGALQELVALLGVKLDRKRHFPPLSHPFYW